MSTLAKEIPTPSAASRRRITGLSGNEIYCLDRLGMRPGDPCIGNSVFALGVMRSLTSGLRTLAGGEVPEIGQLIFEGRRKAFDRMSGEAHRYGGLGITWESKNLKPGFDQVTPYPAKRSRPVIRERRSPLALHPVLAAQGLTDVRGVVVAPVTRGLFLEALDA